MNWLDIAIIIVLGLFLLGGLKNGLIKTICSLAGMVIGVVLAGRYYLQVAGLLTVIPDTGLKNIAAFVIIFIVVNIIATLVAWLLTGFAKAILLGWLNGLLGGAAGFFMGVIAISALLTIWLKFRGPTDVITESMFAGALLNQLPVILSLLPEEFATIGNFFK